MNAEAIQARLQELADPVHVDVLQRFFKTGPGEYGEGDRFLGIRVPVVRKVSREFRGTPLKEVQRLLKSPIHEARLAALLILVDAFRRGDEKAQERVYRLYLRNTRWINNWDLVDLSAYHIVGAWLGDRDRRPLEDLARSESLWERRIAIVATFCYIRQNDFRTTLKIARILLADPEDLIHKAVGWMLREVGKRDMATEERFLRKHYANMPRTMLRYAIERFPEDIRQGYLKGTI